MQPVTLIEMLRDAVAVAPDTPAVITGSETVTFAELLVRVERRAAQIAAHTEPGARVAVLAENCAAVPPTMNAPDGRPTNAIFGFLNMFLKMIDAFNPDGVVVAFDKGKPRVRMEMLPQYKAQRPPMDPDLHAQFPMIKELLTALNVPIPAST